MTVYHTTTAPSDTAALAIDLLCDELRRRAEQLGSTLIQISHRALAASIGCSASRLPALMRRLEAAGSIVRLAYKNTFVVDVAPLIDQPQATDRSVSEPLIDQSSVDPEIAQQDAANEAGTRDRVKTACMEDHESRTQEKELARPLFERLIAQPGMSHSLAQRIAKHPIGTLQDFLHDLQLAKAIPDLRSPFYFTVARWRDGQRVVTPEEHGHAQPTPPTRRDPSRHAQPRRRAERPGADRRAAGPPHVDPSVYAAILADLQPVECGDL